MLFATVALLKPWHMRGWNTVSILESAVESVGRGLGDISTHKDATLSPTHSRALADTTWMKIKADSGEESEIEKSEEKVNFIQSH